MLGYLATPARIGDVAVWIYDHDVPDAEAGEVFVDQ